MENQEQSNEKRINEIISELSDCREDERSSQSQLVQVIATAGTILGVLFGASFLNGSSADSGTNELMRPMFHLCSIMFCVTFGFIVSMGISNVLRFHYIRNLEDRLFELIPKESDKEEFVHWMSFSAPILTRNPKHLKSSYSIIHFSSYLLATFSVVLFCIIIMFNLFMKLEPHIFSDYISMVFFALVAIVSIITFFYSSIKAKDMYLLSLDESIKKRKERLQEKEKKRDKNSGSQKQNKKRDKNSGVFLYFFYPKFKDFQKPLLIILGFFIGIFLLNNTTILKLTRDQILHLILSFIIIDVLIYQARFLWNDIRGINEDLAAGKRDRLPVWALKPKRAIKISLIIIAIRIISAFCIIHFLTDTLKTPLYIHVFLIIAVAIAYEFFRAKNSVIGVIIFSGLGYPIRLSAGIHTAWPDIWENSISSFGVAIPVYMLAILLIAYYFLGLYSVLLSWAHEAVHQKKTRKGIIKSHYKFIYEMLKNRSKKQFPLREHGKITDPWNYSFIISMILLSTIPSIISFLQKSNISVIITLIEALLLVITLLICFTKHKNIIVFTVVSLVIIIAKLILSCWYIEWYPFYIMLCLNQGFFVLLFFILRYQFNPDFHFIKTFKNIVLKLKYAIVGKHTL